MIGYFRLSTSLLTAQDKKQSPAWKPMRRNAAGARARDSAQAHCHKWLRRAFAPMRISNGLETWPLC
jgi:hypothetical protein